ncbi:MAG: hypothetical protein CMM52_12240 [Rhodospirillaceae bacterium]|nr:hypothetical protein [Rhodospirillaceae bacterium]|tara:strand:+ start:7141 stop:7953 length:813 start_codon:yes stop_codon:yes gene_type:complete
MQPNKLPILKIIIFAFVFPALHLKQFVRIAFIPFVCLAIVFAASLGSATIFVIGHFISLVFLVAFVVSWHRLALLGENATARNIFPYFDVRDLKFIGYALLFAVLAALIFFAIGFIVILVVSTITSFPQLSWIPLVVSYLLSALIFYLLCHWLLVFPAVTIDEKGAYSLADTLIVGNRFPFFLAMISIFILLTIAEWLAGLVLFGIFVLEFDPHLLGLLKSDSTGIPQIVSMIFFVLGLFVSAIFASGLSASFRELKRIADAREGAAEAS